MFCKKCGTNLADDSLFCENCGMPVRQAESAPAEPVSPVPPMPPVFEERPPVSIPVQPVTPVWEQPTFEKPKKSSAKWLIPVVIAAAAVVVAAIIAVLLLLGGGGGSSAIPVKMLVTGFVNLPTDANDPYRKWIKVACSK